MSRIGFTVLCVLLAFGFSALGFWQLERRAWKLDLIARVGARVTAPPATPPPKATWPTVNARDHEYLRVRARGVLLNDRETLVQAVTESGPGWWVMTPLQTEGGTVLVNRGFVPADRQAPASRGGLVRSSATITGLIRMSEPHGAFLRSNAPAAGRWYSRDVAAIGKARGLTNVAPFFVDADSTPNAGGYPVGGLTVIAFRNVHLIYALTWFALAALSLVGAALVARSGRST